MIHKDKYNISAIETFFNELLDEKVSSNTFFGGLPNTIQSTWKDMVVVDCSSPIVDMNGRCGGVVSVLLYPAKNRTDGSKDTATISRLTKALNVAIENNTNQTYQVTWGWQISGYDSIRKIYYDVVFLNLTIF